MVLVVMPIQFAQPDFQRYGVFILGEQVITIFS
jgi:hypothetical protein